MIVKVFYNIESKKTVNLHLKMISDLWTYLAHTTVTFIVHQDCFLFGKCHNKTKSMLKLKNSF